MPQILHGQAWRLPGGGELEIEVGWGNEASIPALSDSTGKYTKQNPSFIRDSN